MDTVDWRLAEEEEVLHGLHMQHLLFLVLLFLVGGWLHIVNRTVPLLCKGELFEWHLQGVLSRSLLLCCCVCCHRHCQLCVVI
jgi:hypothetical protein